MSYGRSPQAAGGRVSQPKGGTMYASVSTPHQPIADVTKRVYAHLDLVVCFLSDDVYVSFEIEEAELLGHALLRTALVAHEWKKRQEIEAASA